MANLLADTLEAIRDSGHTTEDILFIGSHDGQFGISWDRFTEVADQEYESGFGSAEVATDLIVLFKDGRKMWRHEYDGSERWDYDAPVSVEYDPGLDNITVLVGRLWPTVGVLHGDDPDEGPYRLQSHPKS